MVTVQRFSNQSQVGLQPTVNVDLPLADPNVTGQQLTRTVQSIAFSEQAKRDKRIALDAVRQARRDADSLWYGEDGGRWKEGQEFFEWSAGAGDSLDKAIMSRTEGLVGPQAEIAQSYMDDIRERFDGNVMQRTGAARRTMYEGGYEVDKENLLNTHTLTSGDPESTIDDLQRGLDEGADLVASYMDEHSEYIDIEPELFARQEVETYESTLVRSSIEKVIQHGATGRAAEYMEEFGHLMSANDLAAAERAIGDASLQGEVAAVHEASAESIPIYVGGDGREIASAAGTEYLSPTAARNARAKEIREHGKREGWTRKQIEEAVAYSKRRSDEQIQTGIAQQTAMFYDLDEYLKKNDGDLRLAQERFPGAWAHLTGEQRDALGVRASDMAAGRIASKDANEWRALDGLRHGTIEQQDAFITRMASGVPAILLSEDHLKAARGWVEDVQQGRAKALDDGRSWNQRVESKIKALDLNDEDADLFHQKASAARANLATDLARSGKIVTSQDEQTLINIQTWEELFDSQGRPIELSDRFFRLSVADIPDPPPAWISSGGGQALVRNGIPQTPANLKALYYLDIEQNGSLTSQRIPPEEQRRAEREIALATAGEEEELVPLPRAKSATPRALTARGLPGAADRSRLSLAGSGGQPALPPVEFTSEGGLPVGDGLNASVESLRARRRAKTESLIEPVVNAGKLSEEDLHRIRLNPDLIEALELAAGEREHNPFLRSVSSFFAGAEELIKGVPVTSRERNAELRKLIDKVRKKRAPGLKR